MSNTLVLSLPALAGVLMAAAVLLVASAVIQVRARVPKERSLALIAAMASGVTANETGAVDSSSARWLWLEQFGRRLIAVTGRTQVTRQMLDFAGRAGDDAMGQFAVRKVMAAGIALGVSLLWAGRGGVWLVAVPLLVLIGFFVPDLLLVNIAQKRTDEIRRRLPDAIDLLNLCVESGMGFQAALTQVAATQDGPVAEELSRVLREMQLGQSRRDALKALAARTKQEDLLRFVSAMNQVDRLGIPIAAVLREQAKEMRARRRDRARERAQKVPVKIMLPVVFCFFPVLIGIVIAPAGIQILRMFASL